MDDSDRLEEDGAVWARLRELRRSGLDYDAENSMAAEEKVRPLALLMVHGNGILIKIGFRWNCMGYDVVYGDQQWQVLACQLLSFEYIIVEQFWGSDQRSNC